MAKKRKPIEIIQLKQDAKTNLIGLEFNKKNLESIRIKNSYIVAKAVIEKLMDAQMPIKNKNIAIKNILDFIHYLESYEDEEFHRVHSRILSEFFTSHHYRRYMYILKENNILSCRQYEDTEPGCEYYKEGEYSMQYGFNDWYKNQKDLCLVTIAKSRYTKKRGISIDERINVNEKMKNTIFSIEIDIEQAIKAEINHVFSYGLPINSLRKRINKILSLSRDRYIRQGIKVERIYHSLSTLSEVSRKHLTIPLYCLDVVNCQPLLLIAYLKQNNYDFDKSYLEDCENGCFY